MDVRIATHLRGSSLRVVLVTGGILAFHAVGGVVLARTLGPADRGLLAALVLWGTLASEVGGLGAANALSFFAAHASPRTALGLFGRAIPLMATIGVVAYVGLVVGSDRLPELPSGAVWLIGVWLMARIAAHGLQLFQQGLDRMARFDALRIALEASPAIGYVALAVASAMTIGTGAATLLVASLLAIAAGLRWARTHGDVADRPLGGRRFWSYAIRSWTTTLSTRANVSADLLILTLLAIPSAKLGHYAVATSATIAIATVSASVGFDLFPRIVGAARDTSRTLVVSYLGFAAAFSVVAALGLFVTADWLVPFVYGQAFEPSIDPILALLPGAVALTIALVSTRAVSALGRPEVATVAHLIGAGVTTIGVVVVADGSLRAVGWAASTGFTVTAFLLLGALVFLLRQPTVREPASEVA